MSILKFVTIKRRPQDRIPSEIFSQAPQYIGGGFSRDTNDVLRGISFEEEEYLLPSIVGISADSFQFVEKVKTFHAEIDIPIPPEGKKLNITTRKSSIINKEGEKKEIDLPVVPMDYIYYKHALKHSQVAHNIDEVNSNNTFIFYIENMEEVQVKTKATREIKLLAKQNIVNLTAGETVDMSLIRAILIVAKEITHREPAEDDEDCLTMLEDISEKYPSKFNAYCADKAIKAKAFVHQLIKFNLIQSAGNSLYDETQGVDPIASSIEEFIKVISQPEKSTYKGQLQAKLKAKQGAR